MRGSPAPTIPYPLSYAVNAGRPDQTVGPPDDARFAAFHDHRQGVPRVSVSLSDVTDGITNTIAITENTDLANWTSVSETHQGVVWFDTPSILANRDALAVFDCDGDGLADNLDYAHARPYSFHSEGFNVAYLDGHVEFFFIDPADPVGAYEMYKARMTPANAD
jgi:prepilin-type processing-associated H-X9-DG protein